MNINDEMDEIVETCKRIKNHNWKKYCIIKKIDGTFQLRILNYKPGTDHDDLTELIKDYFFKDKEELLSLNFSDFKPL